MSEDCHDLDNKLPAADHISASVRKLNPHLFPHHENHPAPQLPNAEPEQRAPALDGKDARKAQGPRCPHVRFVLRRISFLDIDAKYGSVKDLLDGLQIAGLIQGDREGQITLQVDQEKVHHRAEEGTDIEISL